MILQTLIKKMCPYISNPTSNCYCTKESSQDINNAVKYCSNKFEKCSIFKTRNAGFEEFITDN